MKVWRVEHGTGNGVFAPVGPYRFTLAELDERDQSILRAMGWAHGDSNHRAPYLDPDLRHIDWDEVCGMSSREELDTWFTGWHEDLERIGFVISVYEVPASDVRRGRDGQVVFKTHRAVRTGAEFWSVCA